jgi:hypothetical protein
MDDQSTAYEWAKTYNFDEVEIQYMTILALKILDDECKMDYDNYNLFMSVYDGIKDKPNTPLNLSVHSIIDLARAKDPIKADPVYKDAIRELRLEMMKDFDKPTMKAFKNLVWDVVSC